MILIANIYRFFAVSENWCTVNILTKNKNIHTFPPHPPPPATVDNMQTVIVAQVQQTLWNLVLPPY